ncbi:MAG TPA: hypothetical protein PK832_10705 [Anaerolineae bacterium]|nr:hypothetical protein [Anaerolineae bacterium]
MRRPATLSKAFLTTVIVLGMCLLLYSLLPRGPEYLDTPPPEFHDFVAVIPTPVGAIELTTKVDRRVAPKETCTYFNHMRLYGTDIDFTSVKQDYLTQLSTWEGKWLVSYNDANSITIVFGNTSLASIFDLTENLPLARLTVGETAYLDAKESFSTVFLVSLEHGYGNCKPIPDWGE